MQNITTFGFEQGDRSVEIVPLIQFLRSLPFLHFRQFLPPLSVINHFLRFGRWDAGMSGLFEWTPIQIDENEYQELRSEYEKKDANSVVEVPNWVVDIASWRAWYLQWRFQVPPETVLNVLRREYYLLEMMTQNPKLEDDALSVELDGCRSQYWDLIDKYINPPIP